MKTLPRVAAGIGDGKVIAPSPKLFFDAKDHRCSEKKVCTKSADVCVSGVSGSLLGKKVNGFGRRFYPSFVSDSRCPDRFATSKCDLASDRGEANMAVVGLATDRWHFGNLR